MRDEHDFLKSLNQFAARSDPQRVAEAVGWIREFGEMAISSLTEALNNTNPDLKILALQVLEEIESDTEPALPAMIRALDDPDRIVRIAAVGPVGQHAEKAGDAVPILLKWLKTKDEHSRVTAAALLLKIDLSLHDEMMAVLAEGTNSDDSAIRCQTAWLLSELREQSRDVRALLQRMLVDNDSIVRSIVVDEHSTTH